MKKFVLVPDSFKGTMRSVEICEIMKKQILLHNPKAEVLSVPVADGGEGTVECFIQGMGAKAVPVHSVDAFQSPIDVTYGRIADTAIVEMAMCSGLPLAEGRKNPAVTTTYGVGLVMKQAIMDGCKNIILGLGGSCTNDGGAGMAAALGVRFFDKDGERFVPVGNTLACIASIDCSDSDRLLKGITVTAMCDIDNPLYGENGAAYIFAPQKGADAFLVEELDYNLQAYADCIKKELCVSVENIPGSGAAGGMGAGVVAFCHGKLKSGIETILEFIDFDAMIQDADLIFTGEGKIDGQSFRGKVVSGIAHHAVKQKIPVVVIAGDIDSDAELAYGIGISAIVSINRVAVPFQEAKMRCKEDLFKTMDTVLRLISL